MMSPSACRNAIISSFSGLVVGVEIPNVVVAFSVAFWVNVGSAVAVVACAVAVVVVVVSSVVVCSLVVN